MFVRARLRVRAMLWVSGVFGLGFVSATQAADGQPTTNAPSIVFKETLLAKLAPNAKLGEIKISPDNNHVAYTVWHGRKWSVALDGVESGEFDEVRDLLFSPDSTHLAYVRRDSKEVQVVLNGQPGKAYGDIGKGCMAFSPDSQHFIYVGRP